jgi:hypothetical protein
LHTLGKQGVFTVTEHKVAGITMRHYLDGSARESPIPTSLTLEYDAPALGNGINGNGGHGNGVNGNGVYGTQNGRV